MRRMKEEDVASRFGFRDGVGCLGTATTHQDLSMGKHSMKGIGLDYIIDPPYDRVSPPFVVACVNGKAFELG